MERDFYGARSDFDPGTAADPQPETSRRAFLQAAATLAAGSVLPGLRAEDNRSAASPGHNIVLAIIGVVRRAESFSPRGRQNIPHGSSSTRKRTVYAVDYSRRHQ